mgnify:CR=1 FL=1
MAKQSLTEAVGVAADRGEAKATTLKRLKITGKQYDSAKHHYYKGVRNREAESMVNADRAMEELVQQIQRPSSGVAIRTRIGDVYVPEGMTAEVGANYITLRWV